MKIVVFGASGFVGGWICEELLTMEGVDVSGCVRTWAAAARVARRGITLTQVDLDSPDSLLPTITGADVVINAAVPPSNREPELALRLYKACAEAGIRKFIQFSSAAIYGDVTGEVDELVIVAPKDDYGRGKADMENRLLNAAANGGPQLFILRPSIIYGPFSDAWTVRYAQRIANGRWRTLGRFGEGTCNIVHVSDVARAAIMAATSEVRQGSHVLNINGPDAVSWNEYIERFGDALSVSNRTTPSRLYLSLMIFGSEALRGTGIWLKKHLNQLLKSLLGSGRAGPAIMAGAKLMADLYPTTAECELLRRKVIYKAERAAQELKFRPAIPLGQGLAQSASWCRRHGIIS